jgi:hypothetical protein
VRAALMKPSSSVAALGCCPACAGGGSKSFFRATPCHSEALRSLALRRGSSTSSPEGFADVTTSRAGQAPFAASSAAQAAMLPSLQRRSSSPQARSLPRRQRSAHARTSPPKHARSRRPRRSSENSAVAKIRANPRPAAVHRIFEAGRRTAISTPSTPARARRHAWDLTSTRRPSKMGR